MAGVMRVVWPTMLHRAPCRPPSYESFSFRTARAKISNVGYFFLRTLEFGAHTDLTRSLAEHSDCSRKRLREQEPRCQRALYSYTYMGKIRSHGKSNGGPLSAFWMP